MAPLEDAEQTLRRVWQANASDKNESGVAGDPWHAVSIAAGQNCCAAARALGAARFLSAQAPSLPLAQCSSKESCRCMYKHHADRRAKPRRREEITGLRRSVSFDQERRVERDRRKGDIW